MSSYCSRRLVWTAFTIFIVSWNASEIYLTFAGEKSESTKAAPQSQPGKKDPPMSKSEATSPFPEIRSLWDFNDPKKSEAVFREWVSKAEQAGDTSYRLQLLTQVARAQGLQRQFDEAHKSLDGVKESLAGVPPVVRVRYLLERGRVFNSSQKRDESKPLFLEAWNVATKAGEDNLAVDAAHMLGIVEPPDEALRWNDKAMRLAETSPDPACKNWLGSLYNNVGWTYHDNGDYQKSLELFQKALSWHVEKKNPETIQIARWSVARALRSLKRVDEALAIQQELLKEHEKAGNADGFVFEELAECHLAKNHAGEAERYFALAYKALSKDEWLVANEPDRIARIKTLGKQ
jgi:tetratricopeptide (TPR) repeat protein